MKPSHPLSLFAAIFGGVLFLGSTASAQTAEPSPAPAPHQAYGESRTLSRMGHVEIRNLRDERLGRVKEVAIDLSSGRIVEVLVVSGDFLGLGGKVVGVPPAALIADRASDVFWLNVSKDYFDASPSINLSKWADHGRSDKVAAVYRRFGAEPFFLETGDTANLSAARPLVRLGPVARSSKILGMRVQNRQGEVFGKVWRLKLDITGGRVLGVIIESSGEVLGKRLVPSMALSYSPERSHLILDNTQLEFANEPSYHSTTAAYGQKEHHKEETATGPATSVALEQGVAYRDLDRTLAINRKIRASRLPSRDVEVGTLHGRVTLRGWVPTEAARQRIVQIAITESRLELVDDQLVVGPRPANALTGRP